ncbi:hypothetical protein JW851_03945 [Candidatus Woesearchaeota archaeon]|nr:hypothetical protein [Candidatus Woesearchaeota archaeon]
MTPIQIMALIAAILAGIKIIVILLNPKKWMVVVNKIYANPAVATIAGLVIAGVSLNYLLKVMTIVHVFAAILFFAGMMIIGFAAYQKDTLAFANKILKDKNAIKRAWLSIIIWIALIIWVFWILFG